MDGSVRIEGADRTGLERLLRYCARPPFALEHLHQGDAEHLVYRNPKLGRTTAPGTRPAALVLTPLELIDKIAALVPPPRANGHRYFGVLAPNARLWAAVTVKKILEHIGESTQPPRIAPARGPPLWEMATAAEQARNDPQWDQVAQPGPEVEFDQPVAW